MNLEEFDRASKSNENQVRGERAIENFSNVFSIFLNTKRAMSVGDKQTAMEESFLVTDALMKFSQVEVMNMIALMMDELATQMHHRVAPEQSFAELVARLTGVDQRLMFCSDTLIEYGLTGERS